MEEFTVVKKIIPRKSESFYGAEAKRILDYEIPTLNPFVILYNQIGKEGVGYPEHAHKNMEGIIFSTEGPVVHEDSLENKQKLEAGDLCYINAGKG